MCSILNKFLKKTYCLDKTPRGQTFAAISSVQLLQFNLIHPCYETLSRHKTVWLSPTRFYPSDIWTTTRQSGSHLHLSTTSGQIVYIVIGDQIIYILVTQILYITTVDQSFPPDVAQACLTVAHVTTVLVYL